MTKKYYICKDCPCKCTIEAPEEKSLIALNFPCKGGNFKEVDKNEHDKEIKKKGK